MSQLLSSQLLIFTEYFNSTMSKENIQSVQSDESDGVQMSEHMPQIISQIEIAYEEINQILLDTKEHMEETLQESIDQIEAVKQELIERIKPKQDYIDKMLNQAAWENGY